MTRPVGFGVWVDPGDGRFVRAGTARSVQVGEAEGRCEFTYDHAYLGRPDAIAIDPDRLPLPSDGNDPVRPIVQPEGERAPLFGVFRDAAPDGWGRELTERAAGRPLDEVGHLLAAGHSRVGALAFSRATDAPAPDHRWGANPTNDWGLRVVARSYAGFLNDLPTDDLVLRPLFDQGMSLGGARPKAHVRIDGRAWIAKFPSPRDAFPQTRVEHAATLLAGRCGVRVPRTRVETVDGMDVFLIERFDRVPVEGGEARLGFRSALTVLGYDEMGARYASYAELAAAARRTTDTPSDADATTWEVWRRMAFDVLTSNDDDHLRNHGFLRGPGPEGRWSLSPAYDIAPRPRRGSGPAGHAIRIAGDSNAGTADAVVAAGVEMGLDVGAVTAALDDLANRVSAGWDLALSEAGVGTRDREGLRRCVRVADDRTATLGGKRAVAALDGATSLPTEPWDERHEADRDAYPVPSGPTP